MKLREQTTENCKGRPKNQIIIRTIESLTKKGQKKWNLD